MYKSGYINFIKTVPASLFKAWFMITAIFFAVLSASSCFDDSTGMKSLNDVMSPGTVLNSENALMPDGPEIPVRPDVPEDTSGTISISFNVPSMKNAKVSGFLFDSRGAFKGEIGYKAVKHLANGKATLVIHHASSNYSSIFTSGNDLFPQGIYTIHGKFDIHSDGFDSAQGDKGFRVDFAVSGNTSIAIEDADVINPCMEIISSRNRPDLKFATVYAYLSFPGGDPLHYYAYRYDGGVTYVKLNNQGNDLGNTMSEELNAGVYDVLIIADMDDSINDPFEPALSNGDKFIMVKNMVIDGIDPIDISDYVFNTYITDLLPAPRVHLQTALNAISITITNIPGAATYNVYGRSADGYSLIGTVARDNSGELTFFTDFGPNNDYDIFGLPANTSLYYRISAVKGNGVEGEPGKWAVITSGGVQTPEIYGNKVTDSTRVDLLIRIPQYCKEIEIFAMSNSCTGPHIIKYNFPVTEDQRDKALHFSLTDFPLSEGTTYAFTVRGKDLHGNWSEQSSCYLLPY